MKSELKNGVLVISLEGSLTGPHITGPIIDLIKSNLEAGIRKVLFNMAEMKFIDSTGLGMTLSAVSKVKAVGGQLVLCCVPEQMKKLLKMTKLEHAFIQQDDEAAALGFMTQAQ
jgi:anti-sigma B factor antagonist